MLYDYSRGSLYNMCRKYGSAMCEAKKEHSARLATTKPGRTELLHTECWLHSTPLKIFLSVITFIRRLPTDLLIENTGRKFVLDL